MMRQNLNMRDLKEPEKTDTKMRWGKSLRISEHANDIAGIVAINIILEYIDSSVKGEKIRFL